jgi:chaperonin GroEL (HSP60 family)
LGLPTNEQGGGSMAEPSTPAADGDDAATTSGSSGGGRVATVVLRASTDNLLDDLERAIDDGVNNYKVLLKHVNVCRIPRGLQMECCTPGAGA